MTKSLLAAVMISLACALTPACRDAEPAAPAQPTTTDAKPVSGRTSTRAGISVDFADGWAEVPLHGPFTRSYEHRESQLNFDVSDFTSTGDSLAVLGQRMHQDLAREGKIVESGTTTVDGREAYRVLLEKRTDSGHGLVSGLVIPRRAGRVTTIFVSTRASEKPGQRETIAELVSTIRVES